MLQWNCTSYPDFQQLMRSIWASDVVLNNSAPACVDECGNAVFEYGIEHLTESSIRNLPGSYVVINDLGEQVNLSTRRLQRMSWPFRVRVYAANVNDVRILGARFCSVLKSMESKATCLGSVCKVAIDGRQIGQSDRHYFMQFVVRFIGTATLTGVA